MSKENYTEPKIENPPSIKEIEQKIRDQFKKLLTFCKENEGNCYSFEKSIRGQLQPLICLLFQLFLISSHSKFDYTPWLETGRYYKSYLSGRTIKTIYGKVRYWRICLVKKTGLCFHPFDAVMGLTRDGFTPMVMNLAVKLATRVSFSASVLIFKTFCDWSPSSEAMEALVLGMGRNANEYMEGEPDFSDDGEILVIEVDGKATPTAREEELAKRRGPRKKRQESCSCPRHRYKHKRQCRCKMGRRKKGDKSKNGRSITLVVMYTLKKGNDGRLHGPINKKVWGSYAPRKVMFSWARRQATRRGFEPGTDKRIHIVVDGEKCLWEGLRKLFPQASFALDIRHLEEKIWDVGRLFHDEGSPELEKWVEEKVEFLYTGRVAELLMEIKTVRNNLSKRAKREENKRNALDTLIAYMEPRLSMMRYRQIIEEDLVIASGIVEGAARYVVGERMDCSGMRWIPERAESLLRLRCIELNGDWEHFFQWTYEHWIDEMKEGKAIIVRKEKPDELPFSPPFDPLDENDESDDASLYVA